MFFATEIVADEGRFLDFLGLVSQRYRPYGFKLKCDCFEALIFIYNLNVIK